MSNKITPGQCFKVKYPFMRCEVEVSTDTGRETIQSWKPGHDTVEIDEWEGPENVAEGEGVMILDVVDVFQPGARQDIKGYKHKRYPTRVFFLRRFVNPDGVEFGKSSLKIMTETVFSRIASGYQVRYTVQDRELACQ